MKTLAGGIFRLKKNKRLCPGDIFGSKKAAESILDSTLMFDRRGT